MGDPSQVPGLLVLLAGQWSNRTVSSAQFNGAISRSGDGTMGRKAGMLVHICLFKMAFLGLKVPPAFHNHIPES